jgi:hypothetical protein
MLTRSSLPSRAGCAAESPRTAGRLTSSPSTVTSARSPPRTNSAIVPDAQTTSAAALVERLKGMCGLSAAMEIVEPGGIERSIGKARA